jgi:hypothetical protein
VYRRELRKENHAALATVNVLTARQDEKLNTIARRVDLEITR